MDKITKEQRSKNMSKVKSKDTKPELLLRRALCEEGYRYRKNYKALPGKPDIVLTKYGICIFIDGEFWHGKNYYLQDGKHESGKYKNLKQQLENSNNSEFWKHKIESNIKRDILIDAELKGLGWEVIRFWGKDVIKDTKFCIDVIKERILKIKTADIS